jgi:hypothetical protein
MVLGRVPRRNPRAEVGRDGALAFVRRERIGARPTGRPKKHANNAEKQRSYRCRLKNVLTLRNTPSQQIENAQLPSAENSSHGGHVILSSPHRERCVYVDAVQKNSDDEPVSSRVFDSYP